MTEEFLEFAKGLAQAAGEIMLQHFQTGMLVEIKAHEGNTPVTIADTTINRMVIDAVKRHYPTHAVHGEEESHPVAGAKYTWVCDPIDGTFAYAMGVPTNVFSLALVDQSGRPIIAVVYDPYLGRKYWATAGSGAFMNDVAIHVSHQAGLDGAMVGCSGSRSRVIDYAAFRGALIHTHARPAILISAIYEAMLVASGQMSASILPGWHAYDAAASRLIVEEAGGRFTDLLGEDQRYDQDIRGYIASNGAVHDELVALAKQHRLKA